MPGTLGENLLVGETDPYSGPEVSVGYIYKGGLLCCMDGQNLIMNKSAVCKQPDCMDLPKETFKAKITIFYMSIPSEDVPPMPAPYYAYDTLNGEPAKQKKMVHKTQSGS